MMIQITNNNNNDDDDDNDYNNNPWWLVVMMKVKMSCPHEQVFTFLTRQLVEEKCAIFSRPQSK